MRALLLVALASVAIGTSPAPTLTITAAARAIQPGEVVQLTVTTTEPVAAIDIRAFDHAWPAWRVDAATWRALVGIDLDTAPKSYVATVSAGSGPAAIRQTYTLVVKPKTFDTRTLTVDDAFVNPPASVQKRIELEAARLAAIWPHVSPTRLWSGAFVKPVTEDANSAFGKRSVFNGQLRSPHTGADFPSPAGESVKAPAAGHVVLAQELYYSGNTVILDHGLGLYSLFAHFSAIAVHEGDDVEPGRVLGKVGATGRVTGPHLHWAIRLGSARVDPMSIVALVKP